MGRRGSRQHTERSKTVQKVRDGKGSMLDKSLGRWREKTGFDHRVYLFVQFKIAIHRSRTDLWMIETRLLNPIPPPSTLCAFSLPSTPPSQQHWLWSQITAEHRSYQLQEIHKKQIISCPVGPHEPSSPRFHHTDLLTQCDSETKTKGVVGRGGGG